MPSAHRQRGGFTLIELLVVLTIIGILAVMPLNAFRQAYDRAQLRVAAEHLFSILQQAKANAQAHSDSCYGVRLASDTTIMMVHGDVTDDGACDTAYEDSSETLYRSLTVTSTVPEVLFLPPHGIVYNVTDPTVTWTLTTADGLQAEIVLTVSVSTLSLTVAS